MIDKLEDLFARITPLPPDWLSNGKHKGSNGAVSNPGSSPLVLDNDGIECTSYDDLIGSWGKALHLTDNIDKSFSTMLSVVSSTMLQGSQIWLRLIGRPGSAKTILCEAIGANKKWCHNFSKFTGLHSGDAKVPEGERIVDKIINRTCIINEGDTLVSSPEEIKRKILSELRDIYSGILRANYLNGISDDRTGIRSTWILAGTGTLRVLNRSSFGDRFLDVIMSSAPNRKGGTDEEEEAILDAVLRNARKRLRNESGDTFESKDTSENIEAIRKTIGFVDYLREQTPSLTGNIIDRITKDQDKQFKKLGKLVSLMRARPDPKNEDEETEPELPSRLTEQFFRVAVCTAVVLGKPEVDLEVMQRVAKVAEDTCYGSTYDLCKILHKEEKPLTIEMMYNRSRHKLDNVKRAKNILHSMDCIKGDNNKNTSQARGRTTGLWKLSPLMVELMQNLKEIKC